MRAFAIANPLLAAVWLALYFGLAPSRSRALDAAFVVVAVLFAAGGIAGARAGRVARALALAGAAAALAWAVVLLCGVVSAAAYLHGIYGSMGKAASAVAALAGVVVAVFFGVVPALQMARLGQAPARMALAFAAALAVALVLLWLGVWRRYALREEPGLGPAQAARAIDAVRGRGDPGDLADRELWATLWDGGRPAWRERGHLRDLRAPARAGRLKIDVEVARGPVAQAPRAVLALSFAPGLDGVGLRAGGGESLLLPDDLLRLDLLSGFAPIKGERELRVGLDVKRASAQLRRALPRTGDEAWFRVRTQGWLEAQGGGPPIAIRRGLGPPPRLSRAVLRGAAIDAAHYVLRQIRDDGRFRYLWHPYRDKDMSGASYSLPRHAGSTWFLAQAYAATREQAFRDGAARAAAFLAAGARREGDRAWIEDARGRRRATVGAAGLAAVALGEYREATGDRRHDDLLRGLGRFVLSMQKSDGDFAHVWDARAGRATGAKLLYFSGEAAYALARLHRIWPEERTRRALSRALDWLTEGEYAYMGGQFFVGEDHWTCYAAEAAWPALRADRYARFCRAFVEFHRRMQFGADEAGGDFAGAYGVTPFLAPHNTPAASRTEAALACLGLARARGERDDPRLRAQIGRGVGHLVRSRIGPENDYLVRDAAAARGAMRKSATAAEVRIDYAQHAGAALLRAAEMLY